MMTTRPLGARQTAALDHLAEHGYWHPYWHPFAARNPLPGLTPAGWMNVLDSLRTRGLAAFDEANGFYATAQGRLPVPVAAAEILAGLVEMAHEDHLDADEVHEFADLHSQFDANMDLLAYMPATWQMGDARYEKRWNDLADAVDALIKRGDLLTRAGCLPVDIAARLSAMAPAHWTGYLTATLPGGTWAPVSPDTITTPNGSELEWHAGTADWHVGYIDHRDCAPYLHTFDWETGMEHEAHDLNLMLCNDCRAPLFYCRATEWYHHAGPGFDPCFLVQEPGQHVEVPDGFGSGGDDNDHEPCDPQTARLTGDGQPGAVAAVEEYWATTPTGVGTGEVAALQTAMVTAAEQTAGLPARFAAARAGARIAVTDTQTGATAVVGLHAYGEVRAALAALFAAVNEPTAVEAKPAGGTGTVWDIPPVAWAEQPRAMAERAAEPQPAPFVGIPAALDCLDRDAVICPVCSAEIPETYDGTGERTSNNYAGHYTAEHGN